MFPTRRAQPGGVHHHQLHAGHRGARGAAGADQRAQAAHRAQSRGPRGPTRAGGPAGGYIMFTTFGHCLQVTKSDINLSNWLFFRDLKHYRQYE